MKNERPAPHAVGPVRLRTIRGPDDTGRWYWRAERYKGGKATKVWVGWATIEEADHAEALAALRGEPSPLPDPTDPRYVGDALLARHYDGGGFWCPDWMIDSVVEWQR